MTKKKNRKKNQKKMEFGGIEPYLDWDNKPDNPHEIENVAQLVGYLKDKIIFGIKIIFRF